MAQFMMTRWDCHETTRPTDHGRRFQKSRALKIGGGGGNGLFLFWLRCREAADRHFRARRNADYRCPKKRREERRKKLANRTASLLRRKNLLLGFLTHPHRHSHVLTHIAEVRLICLLHAQLSAGAYILTFWETVLSALPCKPGTNTKRTGYFCV